MNNNKEPNGIALLPMIVFLVVYLGSGIYYEYIAPTEDGMGFYVMSVVVAFMIALAVAFCQNRELSFNEKITACAKGIGDVSMAVTDMSDNMKANRKVVNENAQIAQTLDGEVNKFKF